jgi:hypothetical protein
VAQGWRKESREVMQKNFGDAQNIQNALTQ